MSGISIAGDILVGWEHVKQSIEKILTTPIGSRIMRRDFGSQIPDLIDAPMNEKLLMSIFAFTAKALEPRMVNGDFYGEPRFKLEQVEIISVSHSGKLEMLVRGRYIPRGHLGDFSPTKTDVATNIVF